MKRFSLCLLLVVALAGCRRHRPSPEYAQAVLLHDSLHDREGDDAYTDPQMGDAEALLERVSPSSSDADKAAALKAKIASERARVTAENATRQKAIADAVRPPADFKFSEAPRTDTAPAAAPDAGFPDPREGMTVADLAAHHGRCFEAYRQIQVGSKGLMDSWRMKDLGVCRQLYPALVTTVFLIQDGKIWGTVNAADVVESNVPRDAGTSAPQAPPAPPPPAQ